MLVGSQQLGGLEGVHGHEGLVGVERHLGLATLAHVQGPHLATEGHHGQLNP